MSYRNIISSASAILFDMYTRRVEQPRNNALHEAILACQQETALELAGKLSTKEINHTSLGNTPLMLALKTGNLAVAAKILERDDVHVALADYRGITPLHLACAWRANDIILTLLKKCEESGYPTDTGFDFEKLTGVSDMAKKFLAKRDLAKIYNAYDYETIKSMIKTSEYDESIVDEQSLCILPAPELTDALLFHSKLICLNFKLKDESAFITKPSSQHQFASDLMIGLKDIIEHRNSLPKDERVLNLLAPTQQRKEGEIIRPYFQ